MNQLKKKTTVPNPPVGADGEQPHSNVTNLSIPDNVSKRNPVRLDTVTMSELYETIYQSRPPVIDGLLHPGTYLFAGAPKVGKSFLVAQIAYHVGAGIPLWGNAVHQGTALYLALEDTPRRLQERLYRMFGAEGTEHLHITIRAQQIDAGLDSQLQLFVREHPDTRLVIVDTLQKVREDGGSKYSYMNDYDVIGKLKQFADKYGICLLLVHHTRKQQADDKFDMISGTNGLLGAADGAFIMQKAERTGNAATLEVSGRDQQDRKIHLERNADTLAWEMERAETELWKKPPEPLLEEIAKRISVDCTEWCGNPTELVAFLGMNVNANVLTTKLNVNAGRLMEEYSIRYESSRTRSSRRIRLRLEKPPQDQFDQE